MPQWTMLLESLIGTLTSVPELVALVCLFVLNNALWMSYLWRITTQLTRVLWEAVRQLTLLNGEIQTLQELMELQGELLESAEAGGRTLPDQG